MYKVDRLPSLNETLNSLPSIDKKIEALRACSSQIVDYLVTSNNWKSEIPQDCLPLEFTMENHSPEPNNPPFHHMRRKVLIVDRRCSFRWSLLSAIQVVPGKAKVVVVGELGGKFSCCFPAIFTRNIGFSGIVCINNEKEYIKRREIGAATSKFPLPKFTFLFRVLSQKGTFWSIDAPLSIIAGPQAMVGEPWSWKGTFRPDRGPANLSRLHLALSDFPKFVQTFVYGLFLVKICPDRRIWPKIALRRVGDFSNARIKSIGIEIALKNNSYDRF